MKVLDQVISDEYAIYNGDSCEVIKNFGDDSMHFIIYSPPFDSLYTYSNSDRDMSNSVNGEFMMHFEFLAYELYRVLKSGRLMAFHVMNATTSKSKDGFIGIRDLRGELIRLFQKVGFIFHSEVCIWKDPVIAQQRTKAIGLLHKQVVKDSAMSRQGLADYLIVMRKPGENLEPVEGGFTYYNGTDNFNEKFEPEKGRLDRGSIEVWSRYASPVWMDINPSKTLTKEGREDEDEKHMTPTQLDVIERAIQLWSNEGDIVFTPFLGIGSEVYQALKMRRKGIGIELKSSYFNVAVKNCKLAINEREQKSLF
ncbi:DNA-methyltransferase [Campylobacter sp. RM16187]|uniref:DNA-methyltransferase n=1 Tax=Campylobacter sp. RM16187 TaxID=1660063 RepID=UPI0021B5CD19|nr:site-specific DNA-methyltransferase [Campylobacter sp. RM16187]QKG29223.1 DNA methyltransferase [Campylobacter sp. RM16187]